MCLCTGTPGPDDPVRADEEAGGKRAGAVLYLAFLAALAVNLTASITLLAR